jgi:hypothetical protein
MIQKILEMNYKGFHLVLNEEGHGWKCVIGEQEILFPTEQAAEKAIDEILDGITAAIAKQKGVVTSTVSLSQVFKTVEVEKLY